MSSGIDSEEDVSSNSYVDIHMEAQYQFQERRRRQRIEDASNCGLDHDISYYEGLPFQPGVHAWHWLAQSCVQKPGKSAAFGLTGVRIPPTVCLTSAGDVTALSTDELALDSPECVALAAKETALSRIEQMEGSTSSSTNLNTSQGAGPARGIRQARVPTGGQPGSHGRTDDSDDSDDAQELGVRLPGSTSVYATSSSCVTNRPQLIGLTRTSRLQGRSGDRSGSEGGAGRKPWASDWRLWMLRHSLPLYSFADGPPLLLPAMRAGRGGAGGGAGEADLAGGGGDGASGSLSSGVAGGASSGGGTAALAAQVRNVGIPDPPTQRLRTGTVTRAMLLGVTQGAPPPHSGGALTARTGRDSMEMGGRRRHHVSFGSAGGRQRPSSAMALRSGRQLSAQALLNSATSGRVSPHALPAHFVALVRVNPGVVQAVTKRVELRSSFGLGGGSTTPNCKGWPFAEVHVTPSQLRRNLHRALKLAVGGIKMPRLPLAILKSEAESAVARCSPQVWSAETFLTRSHEMRAMGPCVVQAFIKPRGPAPTTYRVVWKKGGASFAWVLRGSSSFKGAPLAGASRGRPSTARVRRKRGVSEERKGGSGRMQQQLAARAGGTAESRPQSASSVHSSRVQSGETARDAKHGRPASAGVARVERNSFGRLDPFGPPNESPGNALRQLASLKQLPRPSRGRTSNRRRPGSAVPRSSSKARSGSSTTKSRPGRPQSARPRSRGAHSRSNSETPGGIAMQSDRGTRGGLSGYGGGRRASVLSDVSELDGVPGAHEQGLSTPRLGMSSPRTPEVSGGSTGVDRHQSGRSPGGRPGRLALASPSTTDSKGARRPPKLRPLSTGRRTVGKVSGRRGSIVNVDTAELATQLAIQRSTQDSPTGRQSASRFGDLFADRASKRARPASAMPRTRGRFEHPAETSTAQQRALNAAAVVESLSDLDYSASKVTGAAIAVPIAQMIRLTAFIERVLGSKMGLPWSFETAVADFVHGDDGRWWMVGLRDFRLSQDSYAACQAAMAARGEAAARMDAGNMGSPPSGSRSSRAVLVPSQLPATMPGKISAQVKKRAVQGSICQFCRLRFHPGERVALFDPEDAATEEEAQLLRHLQTSIAAARASGAVNSPSRSAKQVTRDEDEGQRSGTYGMSASASRPGMPAGHASQRLRTRKGDGRQRLREHARLNALDEVKAEEVPVVAFAGLASPQGAAQEQSDKLFVTLQQRLHAADASLRADAQRQQQEKEKAEADQRDGFWKVRVRTGLLSRQASQACISPTRQPVDSVSSSVGRSPVSAADRRRQFTHDDAVTQDAHSFTAKRFIRDATSTHQEGGEANRRNPDQMAPQHRYVSPVDDVGCDARLLDARMDTDLLQTGTHGALAKRQGSAIVRKESVGAATAKLAARKRWKGSARENYGVSKGHRTTAHGDYESDGTELSDDPADRGRGGRASPQSKWRARNRLQVSTKEPVGAAAAPPTRRSTESSRRSPSGGVHNSKSPHQPSPSHLHAQARRQMVGQAFMPRAADAIGKMAARPDEHQINYSKTDEQYQLSTRRGDLGQRRSMELDLSPTGAPVRQADLPSPLSRSASLTVSDGADQTTDPGAGHAVKHQKRIAGKGLTLDELVRLGPQKADGYSLTLQMMVQTYNRLVQLGVDLSFYRHVISISGKVENQGSAMYQPRRVCRLCYEVFEALRGLNEAQQQLAGIMCAPIEVDSATHQAKKAKQATVAALESDSQVLRQVERSQGSATGASKLKAGLASVQAHTSTESGLSGPMVPARFTIIEQDDDSTSKHGSSAAGASQSMVSLGASDLDMLRVDSGLSRGQSAKSLRRKASRLQKQQERQDSLQIGQTVETASDSDGSDTSSGSAESAVGELGRPQDDDWQNRFSELQTHVRARKLAAAVTRKPQGYRAPLLSRSQSKQVMRVLEAQEATGSAAAGGYESSRARSRRQSKSQTQRMVQFALQTGDMARLDAKVVEELEVARSTLQFFKRPQKWQRRLAMLAKMNVKRQPEYALVRLPTAELPWKCMQYRVLLSFRHIESLDAPLVSDGLDPDARAASSIASSFRSQDANGQESETDWATYSKQHETAEASQGVAFEGHHYELRYRLLHHEFRLVVPLRDGVRYTRGVCRLHEARMHTIGAAPSALMLMLATQSVTFTLVKVRSVKVVLSASSKQPVGLLAKDGTGIVRFPSEVSAHRQTAQEESQSDKPRGVTSLSEASDAIEFEPRPQKRAFASDPLRDSRKAVASRKFAMMETRKRLSQPPAGPQPVCVPVIVNEELMGRGRLHLSDFLADGRSLHVSKHDRVVPVNVRGFGSVGLAMSVGIIRDSVARRAFGSTKHVYTRGNGMFWPPEDHVLPRALPPEWISGMRGSSEEEAAERVLELAAVDVHDDMSDPSDSASQRTSRSGSRAVDVLSQALGLRSTEFGGSQHSTASGQPSLREADLAGELKPLDTRALGPREARPSLSHGGTAGVIVGKAVRRASIAHSPGARPRLTAVSDFEATGIMDDSAGLHPIARSISHGRQTHSRRSSVDASLDLAAQRALRSHASPHLSDRHKLEKKLPLQSLAVTSRPGSVRLESKRGHLVSLTAGAAASVARSVRDDDSDRHSRASMRSRGSRGSRSRVRRNSLVAPVRGESAALKSPPSQLKFDLDPASGEDLHAVAVLRSLVYPPASATQKQSLGYRVTRGYIQQLIKESQLPDAAVAEAAVAAVGGDAIVPKLDVLQIVKSMWVDEFVRASVEHRKRELLKRKMIKSQVGMLGLAAKANRDGASEDGSHTRSEAGSIAGSLLMPGRSSLQSVDSATIAEGMRRVAEKETPKGSYSGSAQQAPSAPVSEIPLSSLTGRAIHEDSTGSSGGKPQPLKLKHLPKSMRDAASSQGTPIGSQTPSTSRKSARSGMTPVARKFQRATNRVATVLRFMRSKSRSPDGRSDSGIVLRKLALPTSSPSPISPAVRSSSQEGNRQLEREQSPLIFEQNPGDAGPKRPPPPPPLKRKVVKPSPPPRKASRSRSVSSGRSGSRSSRQSSRRRSKHSRARTLWGWVRGMVLDGTLRKRFAPPDAKTAWKLAAALLECSWIPPSGDLQKSLVHQANKAVSRRNGKQGSAAAAGNSPLTAGRKLGGKMLTRVGTFRRGKGARSSLLPALTEGQALDGELEYLEGSQGAGGKATALVPFAKGGRRPSATSSSATSVASKQPPSGNKDDLWEAELRLLAERAVTKMESHRELMTWQQLLVKVDASHLSLPNEMLDEEDGSASSKGGLAEARLLFTGINTRSYFGHRIGGSADGDEQQDSRKEEEDVDHQVLNLLAKKTRRRASVEGFKALVGKALSATHREKLSQDKKDLAAIASAVATDRLQQMLTSPLLRGNAKQKSGRTEGGMVTKGDRSGPGRARQLRRDQKGLDVEALQRTGSLHFHGVTKIAKLVKRARDKRAERVSSGGKGKGRRNSLESVATVMSDLSGGSDVDSDGDLKGTDMEGMSEREGITSTLAKDAAAMARVLGASPTSPAANSGRPTKPQSNVVNLGDLPDFDADAGKSGSPSRSKKGHHQHHEDAEDRPHATIMKGLERIATKADLSKGLDLTGMTADEAGQETAGPSEGTLLALNGRYAGLIPEDHLYRPPPGTVPDSDRRMRRRTLMLRQMFRSVDPDGTGWVDTAELRSKLVQESLLYERERRVAPSEAGIDAIGFPVGPHGSTDDKRRMNLQHLSTWDVVRRYMATWMLQSDELRSFISTYERNAQGQVSEADWVAMGHATFAAFSQPGFPLSGLVDGWDSKRRRVTKVFIIDRYSCEQLWQDMEHVKRARERRRKRRAERRERRRSVVGGASPVAGTAAIHTSPIQSKGRVLAGAPHRTISATAELQHSHISPAHSSSSKPVARTPFGQSANQEALPGDGESPPLPAAAARDSTRQPSLVAPSSSYDRRGSAVSSIKAGEHELNFASAHLDSQVNAPQFKQRTSRDAPGQRQLGRIRGVQKKKAIDYRDLDLQQQQRRAAAKYGVPHVGAREDAPSDQGKQPVKAMHAQFGELAGVQAADGQGPPDLDSFAAIRRREDTKSRGGLPNAFQQQDLSRRTLDSGDGGGSPQTARHRERKRRPGSAASTRRRRRPPSARGPQRLHTLLSSNAVERAIAEEAERSIALAQRRHSRAGSASDPRPDARASGATLAQGMVMPLGRSSDIPIHRDAEMPGLARGGSMKAIPRRPRSARQHSSSASVLPAVQLRMGKEGGVGRRKGRRAGPQRKTRMPTQLPPAAEGRAVTGTQDSSAHSASASRSKAVGIPPPVIRREAWGPEAGSAHSESKEIGGDSAPEADHSESAPPPSKQKKGGRKRKSSKAAGKKARITRSLLEPLGPQLRERKTKAPLPGTASSDTDKQSRGSRRELEQGEQDVGSTTEGAAAPAPQT